MLNQSGHYVLGCLPAIARNGASANNRYSLSNLLFHRGATHPEAVRRQCLVIKGSWGFPAVLIKAECGIKLLRWPFWAFCRDEPSPNAFCCCHILRLTQPIITGGRARKQRSYPFGTMVDSMGDFLGRILRKQGLQGSGRAFYHAVEVYPGGIRGGEI